MYIILKCTNFVLLQTGKNVIVKWESSVIRNCGNYYWKMGKVLQNRAIVVIKWVRYCK